MTDTDCHAMEAVSTRSPRPNPQGRERPGRALSKVSPRVGHLHITVDDLPWWWMDASDNNTVDIAGLPPGQHKVKIEFVDSNHNVFPGQAATLTFTVLDHDGAKAHSF